MTATAVPLLGLDTVVYVRRRGSRSLRCDIEEAIIEGMKARLARTGMALEVKEMTWTGKQEDSLAMMRRAMLVFGVHGGGLANAVFAKPGTAFIEIMPIRIMHLLKHRTSKYTLPTPPFRRPPLQITHTTTCTPHAHTTTASTHTHHPSSHPSHS